VGLREPNLPRAPAALHPKMIGKKTKIIKYHKNTSKKRRAAAQYLRRRRLFRAAAEAHAFVGCEILRISFRIQRCSKF
jgi:hypothetical protein